MEQKKLAQLLEEGNKTDISKIYYFSRLLRNQFLSILLIISLSEVRQIFLEFEFRNLSYSLRLLKTQIINTCTYIFFCNILVKSKIVESWVTYKFSKKNSSSRIHKATLNKTVQIEFKAQFAYFHISPISFSHFWLLIYVAKRQKPIKPSMCVLCSYL